MSNALPSCVYLPAESHEENLSMMSSTSTRPFSRMLSHSASVMLVSSVHVPASLPKQSQYIISFTCG